MIHIQSTQQLGRTIRTARKQLGLTQAQLALAAGVGVRFIVDLEAGKPTLQLGTVLRVIDALGGALNMDVFSLELPSELPPELPAFTTSKKNKESSLW